MQDLHKYMDDHIDDHHPDYSKWIFTSKQKNFKCGRRTSIRGSFLRRGDFMGKIFAAIDAQIIKPRTVSSEDEGFKATKDDIENFYSQGNPTSYKRTNAYGDSPRSTGVTGENGDYDYSIYLEKHEYQTGTPGFPVFDEAQWKGSGILGRGGTWFESEEDIKKAIMNNFS